MNLNLRKLRAALPALAMGLTLAVAGAPGMAAESPAVPATITMVVPFPPGGSNDVFARVLAEKLGARLSKTVPARAARSARSTWRARPRTARC
ncbi:hypothetical protein [Achromobacter sp.]|uniref:hypothetical protein n=1 Tax=Achromobacter sp. TaxID=134375 RepID=UPI00257F0151